jgi:hypothetical protein
MNTSEQYHRPVLEALCAFVREETKNKTGDEPPTADVQAALTVIGRRSREGAVDLHDARNQVDLHDARIPKADLGGADLTRANLGRADLTGAELMGAHLSGANLRDAHMNGADLDDADLTGADLRLQWGLTQEQLDQACGAAPKGLDTLHPPLSFHDKPCPWEPP